MPALLVCPAQHVSHQVRAGAQSQPWVYIGKDLDKRETLARLLDEKHRFPLGNLLHRTADRLRQPFLDFIADLGRIQTDHKGWWSSSCSWKDVGRTDLFLLICYAHVIAELRQQWKDRDGYLLVLIDDPWLFRQLQESYADALDVHVHGHVRLWPRHLKAAVWGASARLVWSLRLLRNYYVQQWYWMRQALPQGHVLSIGLYTYPQSRCLEGNDEWVDHCLGDLDRRLEKEGHAIVRFTPPEIGGFERAIAQRAKYFAPLILCATVPALWHSLFAFWRPVWPMSPEVGAVSVSWLLRREWKLDRWRSSYMIFELFHRAVSKLLQAKRLKLIIFQYENQPWEKMLIMAARAHGVPTIGYQHGGGLSRFNLASFHGTGEAAWAPLPDIILTSGPYTYELMAAGGTPPMQLMVGGNLRHQYLWDSRDNLPPSATKRPVRILVTLPIDEDLGKHLLRAVRKAFPEGGAAEGIQFAVKPHPAWPITEKILKFPAFLVSGSLQDAIRSSAAIIYTGTGTGMEAVVMGRVALRYRSELLLNTDRVDLPCDNAVLDCEDDDLREQVLSVLDRLNQGPTAQVIERLLNQVFPPPNGDAWLGTVARLSATGRG